LEVASYEVPEYIVNAFNDWKIEHGRSYANNAYEEYRLRVFMKNFMMIEEHNTKNDETYVMAAN